MVGTQAIGRAFSPQDASPSIPGALPQAGMGCAFGACLGNSFVRASSERTGKKNRTALIPNFHRFGYGVIRLFSRRRGGSLCAMTYAKHGSQRNGHPHS
jgi:hypothetical protein